MKRMKKLCFLLAAALLLQDAMPVTATEQIDLETEASGQETEKQDTVTETEASEPAAKVQEEQVQPETEAENENENAGGTAETDQAETDQIEEIDYIKGRPLTEEEIATQRAHEPEHLSEHTQDFEETPAADFSDEVDACGAFESRYDPRGKNLITPVKDQGDSQWCWSYALMSAAETSMLKNGLTTDPNIDLSEGALVYYFYHMDQISNPLSLTKGDQNKYLYSAGSTIDYMGNTRFAGLFLSEWAGVKKESFYHLSDAQAGKNVDTASAFTGNQAVLRDLRYIANDRDEVKRAIREFGSVTAAVYMDTWNYFNYDTAAFCCPETETSTNHEITLVGWDDTYSKANFLDASAVTADGAWIVKNSWGSEEWGDNGYFYISYEDKSLFPMTALSMQSASNYKHNYFYDGSTNTNTEAVYNGGMIANEFVASANPSGAERLDAVSVVLRSTNVDYSVQIYRNLTDVSNPLSGTPALAGPVTGSTTYGGLYTIPLSAPVYLKEGERFAVVITLSAKNDPYVYYGVEESWNHNWVQNIAANAAGQSFVYDEIQFGGWKDLATSDTTECARIKAYTNDAKCYKVTYKNGSKVLSTQSVIEGQSAKNPKNLQKNGYLFSWSTTNKNIRKDTVINAVFQPVTYQIIFDRNGGSGSMAAQKKCQYNKSYKLSANKYKKSGYTFLGWNTKSNGKGTWYTNKAKIKNLSAKNGAKVKLYAQWAKIPQISSLKNKGKKTVQVQWKKTDAKENGYQIVYAANAKFKSAKTVTVKGYKKSSATIKKLSAGKKYYVKIRSYRKVGRKTYYSGYSKTKTIRVAKK